MEPGGRVDIVYVVFRFGKFQPFGGQIQILFPFGDSFTRKADALHVGAVNLSEESPLCDVDV